MSVQNFKIYFCPVCSAGLPISLSAPELPKVCGYCHILWPNHIKGKQLTAGPASKNVEAQP